MNSNKNMMRLLAILGASRGLATSAALTRGGDANERLQRIGGIVEVGSDAAIAVGDETAGTNVLGQPLAPCSSPGMAKTGWTRSGECVDQEGDTGSHHICIDLTSTSSSAGDFCVATGQPDWCADDMPCHEDENENCPAKDWCVCQWAFEMYLGAAGGCGDDLKLKCDAVNMKAVEAYRENIDAHGDALECLKTKCPGIPDER